MVPRLTHRGPRVDCEMGEIQVVDPRTRHRRVGGLIVRRHLHRVSQGKLRSSKNSNFSSSVEAQADPHFNTCPSEPSQLTKSGHSTPLVRSSLPKTWLYGAVRIAF